VHRVGPSRAVVALSGKVENACKTQTHRPRPVDRQSSRVSTTSLLVLRVASSLPLLVKSGRRSHGFGH